MRTAFNSLAAIATAAALWFGAVPASATVVTYDLNYTSAPYLTLTGSVTFDNSCTGTCPVISFSTHFDTGFTSYDFDGLVPGEPSIFPQIELAGGVPTGLTAGDGAEGPGPDDVIFFLIFSDAWGATGVIDGSEFNELGTLSFALAEPSANVPEPASALLLLGGIAALGWRRRNA